jgi:hypothetical protein
MERKSKQHRLEPVPLNRKHGSVPKAAFHRHNSQDHAAIKHPIDQEHDGISGVHVVAVKKKGLRPVGDHHAGQTEDSGPCSWSGVKADRARDQSECGSPYDCKDQCRSDDSHISTLAYICNFP